MCVRVCVCTHARHIQPPKRVAEQHGSHERRRRRRQQRLRLLGIGVAHQQGLDISVRGTVEGLEMYIRQEFLFDNEET